MKTLPLKLLASLLLFLPAGARLGAAQIQIVKKADDGKQRLTLTELRVSGEMGKVFQATLQHNLERSGWFEVIPDRKAGIHLQGTASGTETALRADITVTAGGNRFNWREQTDEETRGARRLAHRLNDEIVHRVTGRPGMASSRIVMIGKHDGSDLYVCDADGYGLYRLTQDRVPCLAPNWDPTGTHIFYTSYLRGFPCIYRVPAEGGQRLPLAKFTGLNTGGAVSPDRKLMALILSIAGNPELYILNLSTRNLTRLTHTPRAVEASPDWSPDGQSLVYVSDVSGTPQLYVVHATDKQPKRLTYRGGQNVAPDWGPDGRIVYCTRRQGYQIAVLNPATGEDEVLTSGPDHEDPSWAPDARHIICARRDSSTRSTLYVLDTMGDPPLRLFARDGNWTSPDWSAR